MINGTTYNNIVSGTPFNTGVTASAAFGALSIWNNTPSVGVPSGDASSVEVGVKFRSSVPGTITGIRFYKDAANTGTHTGTLWTSTGTLLATATFSGETASGWQQVTFSTPVAILPGVTYVASYYAPAGNYTFSANAFTGAGVTNASNTLTALQSGVDGSNGVYLVLFGGGFPTSSFSNANYWVDVTFRPSAGIALFNLTGITSAAGCVTTGSPLDTAAVSITQVDATAVITHVLCNGATTGVLAVTGINGTAPYQYSINGGTSYQPTGTFPSLAAGSYTLRIKDATNCIKDTLLVITQPAAISATVVVTPVTCFGSATGTITVTSTGGVTPYLYSRDTGATYQSSGAFTSFLAGNHLIKIKDSNNCVKDTVITITQPAAVSATVVKVNADCFGASNGTITVTGTGGISPYTYSRDSGVTYLSSGAFTNYAAGNHLVKIKDSNNCVKDTIINITQPVQITGTITQTTATTCNGSTVNLTFNQTAGLPAGPYTLVINGTTYNNIVSGTPFNTGVTASAAFGALRDRKSVV